MHSGGTLETNEIRPTGLGQFTNGLQRSRFSFFASFAFFAFLLNEQTRSLSLEGPGNAGLSIYGGALSVAGAGHFQQIGYQSRSLSLLVCLFS